MAAGPRGLRRWAAVRLALCAWLWAGAAAAGAGAPEAARGAAEYLSDDAFPGLHVLERVGAGPRLLLHRTGQRPEAAGRPPREADSSRWRSLAEARAELERLLAIPEREPLQLDWAIFDAQGRPVRDLQELRALPAAFILEIGQWMWPAVRIGFEHTAFGVNGEASAILRTLSVRPVVFEVRDFISKGEAKEVMDIGRKQGLHKSQGVLQSADIQKKTKHAQFRTSKQAWLHNGMAPVIEELDKRVANLTRVSASHNEPVQLLRYNEGQYYHGHMDWTELELYPDQRNIWRDSHFGYQDRLATVFWYLNDVAEGGETFFPKHGQPICQPEGRGGKDSRHCPGADDPNMASCEQGLKVPPRRGTVILWYNFHANGRGDRNALHAGCPVGNGITKWSANKWVRIKPADEVGPWIDNHPAMERHGWVDARRPAAPDPNACTVTFTNNAGEAVDLMWYHPGERTYKKLSSVLAGQTLSQNSFHGHAFQLWSPSRKSDEVECRRPRGDFELTSGFRLHKLEGLEL